LAAVVLALVALLGGAACGESADRTGEGPGTDLEAEGSLPWQTDAGGDLGSADEIITGQRIPDDFPSDVPLPDDYSVDIATESRAGAGEGTDNYVLQLQAAGDTAAVFASLHERFDGTGWQELQRSETEVGGTAVSSATYSNGRFMVNLGVAAGEDDGTTAVTYAVIPAGATVGG
jgi:hypothetical protein